MENKSLKFVKNRIKLGYCSGMEDNNYESMTEIKFMDIMSQFDNLFKNNKASFILSGEIKDLNLEGDFKISIEYNPDEDFEYFTMESLICDGILCFYNNLCVAILQKILQVQTVNSLKRPDDYDANPLAYDLEYTVGNFVLLSEYDKEFASKEKPWMMSRFTVCLPIKMNFIRKDN